MDKIVDFIKKFADNANLGKVATDFSPGIIITISILLLLNTFTEMEIFPYAKRLEYSQRTLEARHEADSVKFAMGELQTELEGIEKLHDSTKSRADSQRISRRDAGLESLGKEWRSDLQILNARRDDEQQILKLKANLEALGDNFASLLTAGFLLGIIFAQVSGKVFYNGLFYSYIKNSEGYKTEVYDIIYRRDHRTSTYFQLKIDDEKFLNRLPNLEVDYFRYLEVAMNMILPCAILSLTLIIMTVKYYIAGDHSIGIVSLILSLTSAAITLLLYLNARVLYVGYFMKKADVMKILLEKTNSTPLPNVTAQPSPDQTSKK